jgi:hypothetical protein
MATKSSAFSRNGDDAPKSIKVRTVTHADARSMQDSAKQTPNVRLTFKEGEARTVRFLHEPFDRRNPWVEYGEHYIQGGGGNNGGYVPCIEDCTLDADFRPGKRWYVNVWDRDSKQVRLLKLTGAMVENLIIKFERRGTIMDRDYSITRTGEGTDTKYHIEAEEKEAFTQRPKQIDINAYLDQQAQAYYGSRKLKAQTSAIDDDDEEDVEDVEDTEEDEDEEEAPRKVVKGKTTTKRRPVADEDEDEEDESGEEDESEDEEDEDEDERPVRTKAAAGRSSKAAAVEEDEDEDTDEDDEEDEDEEDEAPRRKTTKTTSRPTTTTTKRPLGSRR